MSSNLTPQSNQSPALVFPETWTGPEKLLEQAAIVAKEASTRAYVPYSHFPVGAALILKDGTIVPGCNVENASYGLANCAERTAMFSAIAQGHSPEEMIGLLTYTPTRTMTTPCGACRQVMAELLGPEGIVILTNDSEQEIYQVKDLLPNAFDL